MTGLRDAVGSVTDRALDLAMPATCIGCYREGTTLCRECRAELAARLRSVTGGITAVAPPPPLVQLESCGVLAGITGRALGQLSQAGERRFSQPLGEAIASLWASNGTGGDVLVPVPDAADLVRERGYDPTVLLARAAGRRLRLPVVEALGRAPELGDAFETLETFTVIDPARIEGRWIVLVDDVVTTGATVAACAAALLGAGARMVSAVTVARDRWTEQAPMTAVARA